MSQRQKRKGFRQRPPPLLDYLHGILRKYPDGGQIIKELIQNADDAGASEVILLYDERSFETRSLFAEGLASAQGPALLAYNDGLFSEADWDGIQKPGRSCKVDDPSTVGRFGLGFNSVYHITDFPSMLSGEYLGVLDPQEIALNDGGPLWSVTEWEEVSDQFQPFWAALKSLGKCCPPAEGYFPGTLFRFPLRCSPSKISENVYSAEQARQLLHSFLDDAPVSLLFLKNVRQLMLGLVGPDGAITELLRAEAIIHPLCGPDVAQGVRCLAPEAEECWLKNGGNAGFLTCGSDPLDDNTEGAKLDTFTSIAKLALHRAGQATRCDWLVLSAVTKKDAFPELWDLSVSVRSEPALSLAYPLQGSCSGRLSCVLPLPATEENTTRFPLHISAPFMLTDDRRHVQWSEEGSQALEANARWNHLLMEEVLPAAYCQMLLLASGLSRDSYGAWPNIDHSQQLRYKALVDRVCQRLIDMKVLVRAGDGQPRLLRPCEAVLLPESVTDKPVGLALEKALILAGSQLAVAPRHVRQALVLGAKGRPQVQQATAQFVRESLRRAAHIWSGISSSEKLQLLEYMAGDGRYKELKDLPLLPTTSGTFATFGDTGATVFVENGNFPRILLPGLAHRFLPTDLNPELLKHLQAIAEAKLFQNLVSLDQRVIEQNFRASLPSAWNSSSSSASVAWCPKEHPNQPSLEWLTAFWTFLNRHVSSLVPFQSCPLIPLMIPNNSPNGVQLARLLPQPTLLFQSRNGYCLPAEVTCILERLGCTVIQSWEPTWCHHQLKEYILEPTPGSVLQAFAHVGVKLVAARLSSLSTLQVEQLTSFLSAALLLSQKEINVLTALPLFFKMPSLLPPSLPGLVPAQSYSALAKNLVPSVPADLLTSEPVLLCRNEAEHHLLLQLRRSLLGTPELCLMCVKAMRNGAYARHTQDAQRLMLWILRNGDALFSQNQELRALCHNLPFVDCGSGNLAQPSDLFDPENRALQTLLRPHQFPTGPFREPEALRTLRTLGLKSSLSAISPADAIMVAKEVNQLKEVAIANAKSQALIQVCNETPLLSHFSSQELKQLQSLAWVPATNPSMLGHLCAPQSLRSEKYAVLVGRVMGTTNAFRPQAAQMLGLECSPPSEKVVENLACLAQEHPPPNIPVLTAMLHSIYQHMQQHVSDFRKPPPGPAVWNGIGFSLPADVVLAYPDGLDLSTLMPRVPLDFQRYSQLFITWGVHRSLKEEEVCQALHKLADQINLQPQGGTQAELRLVVAVLDWLRACGHHSEREISVPVQIPGSAGFVLCPANVVLYCDMDRTQLAKLDGDQPTLVHEAVPPAIAAFLDVEMLSTRLSGLELFEAWGPSEPVTLRIRNILREYSQDADVFQELLQNAEDAGAKTCRFLIDLRQHNGTTCGLLDPGMAACQGPALWSYNDAQFSETDFCNIIQLGAATKESQDDKIGRFGLGFCAVYHMTDVPSLLSGETLLIFDPNITHLQKHIRGQARPGIRLKLTRQVTTAFPEQFRPYWGTFGCHPGEDYRGTLIRLPFRTEQEAKVSAICPVPFGPTRIKALQDGFQEMCQYLLIFLHNVQEVSLTHLPCGSKPPEAARSLATVSRKPFDSMGFPSVVQLTATWESDVVTSYYLLHSCTGTGEALELFQEGRKTGACVSPPAAGVALPIRPATVAGHWVPALGDFKGRVFCFLPLPLETGLPLHVTAAFAVLSNRKGLWEPTKKGQWNRALLRDSVVGAWLGALSLLRDMYKQGLLEDYEYYTFWPDVSNARHPFTEAAKAFFQELLNNTDGEQPVLFSDGQRWCPARDACILDADILSCEQKLKSIACKVFSLLLPEPRMAVSLPHWVKLSFQASGQTGALLPNTYDWARFLRELVLPNLAQLAEPERDALILHALDMNDASVDHLLRALPCIPTTPNKLLRNIKELVHPRGRVTPLYTPEDGRFPIGTGFLQPKRLLHLECLGMTKDWVTMEELISRARTVEALWQRDPHEAITCIHAILNHLSDHLQESSSNTAQSVFREIPFLPAVLPGHCHKPCCPSKMYHYQQRPLVGLTEPILAKDTLEGFKFSKELKEFLGLSRQPPTVTVLEQLKEASRSSNALSRAELTKITEKCYAFLNEKVKSHQDRKEVSKQARTFPFVLVETGFVSVGNVAYNLTFDAAPYLFQLPQAYQQQKQLWDCIGLPETFDVKDYATVLQALAENSAGQSLSERQLELVTRLITIGLAWALPQSQQVDSYEAHSIFFPDQDGVLRPLPKLLFNDTPWLPHEKGTAFCHSMISREVAVRYGIPTTKHRMLSRCRMKGFSPWAMEFGAKEDLCTRLANILSDYCSSQDVLKELLQNADDAGASIVHFVWDRRHHPSVCVFSDEWKALQGPALCAYNDRTFQMSDLEGIQRLGCGGKGRRQDATGKFGLGFNTVYHLTDCPAFVTGNSALCVFDPTLRYLPDSDEASPGAMYSLSKYFKDAFQHVYDAFLPDTFDLEHGTLFRLPLRTPANAASSPICQHSLSKESMKNMLSDLSLEADCLMLFLNHVRCMVFSVINETGGVPIELLRVETNGGESQRLAYQEEFHRAGAAGGADVGTPVRVFYEMEVKSTAREVPSRWLVGRQIGVEGMDATDGVLLPHGGVAACVHSQHPGRAFCTLPLPVKTGLPIHVNGNFAVDSARQDLRNDDSRDSVENGWNSFLLKRLVAPLYCHLLEELRKALGSPPLEFSTMTLCLSQLDCKYLEYFPSVTESVPPFWHQLVSCVYELACEKQLPLLPVYKKETKCMHPVRVEVISVFWSAPKLGHIHNEPYFLPFAIKDPLERVLLNLGMQLVPACTTLLEICNQFTKAGTGVLVLNAPSLCSFLHSLPNLCLPRPLVETPVKNRTFCSALLDFCLHDLRAEDTACLQGLPLLLTKDGVLRCFRQQEPVYYSGVSHLFPQRLDHFSDCVNAEAKKLLVNTGFLKGFTLSKSVKYIQEILAQDGWASNADEGQVWLRGVWQFFETQICTSNKQDKMDQNFAKLVSLFKGCSLLPVHRFGKCLVSLDNLQVVVGGSSDVANILCKLGFAKLDMGVLPVKLVVYCIRPQLLQVGDPTAVLVQLAAHDSASWHELKQHEFESLLRFLSRYMKKLKDGGLLDKLKALPVFQTQQGNHVALSRYNNVYILVSKLPVEESQNFKELYEVDGGTVFLKDCDLNNHMATYLGVDIMNDFQQFLKLILPRVPHLPEARLLEAVRLFLVLNTHSLWPLQAEKETVISKFQSVAFIRDRQGVLRPASYFYDKDDQLFHVLKFDSRFVPDKFYTSVWPGHKVEVKQFLCSLGLRKEISEEDILECAAQIAREALAYGATAPGLCKRRKVLLQCLLSKHNDSLSDAFLKQLSQLRFLVPQPIDDDLCHLHPPYISSDTLVAPQGSLLNMNSKNVRLSQSKIEPQSWTSVVILPFVKYVGENEQAILTRLGVLCSLPASLVLKNLSNVSQAQCDNPKTRKTRASVLCSMYKYLSEQGEIDTSCLRGLPVVLVDNDEVAEAQNVVHSLECPDDFRPYLYKMPRCLYTYLDLMEKFGVEDEPSIYHYANVLARIHEESLEKATLQANLTKAVIKATAFLFQLLDKKKPLDLSKLKELYLPCDDGKLYPSNTLTFSPYSSSEHQFKVLKGTFSFLVDLSEVILPYDKYEQWNLLCLLPEALRPKHLSSVTGEQLEQSSLKLCLYGERCEFQSTVKELLVSPKFQDALIALLKWQKTLAKEPDSKDGWARDQLCSVERLEVICCEKVCTVMVYNSQCLEGTQCAKPVFVMAMPDGKRQIYLEHEDSVNKRRAVKIAQTLATEANSLMGGILQEKAKEILVQILACQEPDEIIVVLEENQVPLHCSTNLSAYTLPSPGERIREEWYDSLDMSLHHTFVPGDYVGFLDSSQPGEHYFYAVVLEALGPRQSEDGQVPAYRVDLGGGKQVEVGAHDLYHFRRSKPASGLSKAAVLVQSFHTSATTARGDWYQKSLNEMKKEVDAGLAEIRYLSEVEKKKAMRRLYLCYHPDKNVGHEKLAEEIFKYLKEKIKEMKNNGKLKSSSWASQTDISCNRNFHNFSASWSEWDQQAFQHRERRSAFTSQSGSGGSGCYFNYNFWSYHQTAPKCPHQAEAKRWLQQGECDLQAAAASVGQGSTEWVLFKTHQAMQKVLTAVEYNKGGRFDRNLSLAMLAEKVATYGHELAKLPEVVAELRHHGVDNKQTQYPSYHLAPIIPNKAFPACKEQDVLQLAQAVLTVVKRWLGE